MGIIVRQSTALTVALGPFLDSTDGNTIEGALTITQPDIRLSKNGAAFAQKSAAQTLSHMENGYYSLSLSTTDTDTVGSLRVHCHESGALPVWEEFQVIEEVVYDALFAASAAGLLGVNVVQAAGTAWNSGAIGPNTLASDTITAAKIAAGAITAAKFAASAIDATAIASGALTSAKFAAGAFDAVWTVATRLLSAGTNIVLAKGTGITGFNDLSAAQVNTEADAAISDAALVSNLAAVKAKTDQLTFTVANVVNANIEAVNAQTITGDGSTTPWGP